MPSFLQRQALDQDVGELPALISQHATPLQTDHDLDPLLERIGDAPVVMLGEATHGTSEFYTWRARLSQRLINEHGFDFIAVEGDWPDCYRLNRFIKGYENSGTQALDVAHQFQRWPTWMWANWEVVTLLDWLQRLNKDRADDQKVGFYGLDLYSLEESLESILAFLKHHAPDGLPAAQAAFRCFEPFDFQGQEYGSATSLVGADCREQVLDLLVDLKTRQPTFGSDHEEAFNTRQNARVLVNAEEYYRIMIRGGPDSWNVRDRHMAQTLADLLDFHGPGSRAIVWEHNTHIGDARFTDMVDRGMVNLGSLAREQYGEEEVVLVGFGTYQGQVIAADSWGSPMEEMVVPPAAQGSWEEAFHQSGHENCLLIMESVANEPAFFAPRGHRAIGVIYHPEHEHRGNYVPTVLGRRYDAFIFIDKTQALHPLHLRPSQKLEPETYPWGI